MFFTKIAANTSGGLAARIVVWPPVEISAHPPKPPGTVPC